MPLRLSSNDLELVPDDQHGHYYPRPISFSACELDRGSESSEPSPSGRRASYATAAESGDLLFLMKTAFPPEAADSDLYTSGYTTQETGSKDYFGRSSSFRESQSFPVLDRWKSTGSLSLQYTLTDDNDLSDGSLKVEDDEPERGTWDSPVEFILSCLGYAVGLGNIWRFPYMCYTNGGGAFLIPYTLMLMLIGIPVFMIELAVGQYSASGPVHVYNAAPLFQGVGVGMVITIWGGIYYQMIITWSLYYMFASWQSVLPWSHCKNSFNTPYCYSKFEASDCEKTYGLWFNQTCYNSTFLANYNATRLQCNTTSEVNGVQSTESCQNVTYNTFIESFNNVSKRLVSPSEEYFNFGMLARSDNLEDTGTIKWDVCLTYLLAWILCYLCILKGIKSSGKVVYFTATFPYLLLVILFFRAVTLPGAGKGVLFYIIPEWRILLSPKVWADAAGQIFFSLSVGGGGLMTFASYNKFHNNIYRDTLIVSIGNCLTSFFAGFVIFSILGFMATELGVEVQDVAKSGSGLAFVAYPEVVTRLPVPQLWATLFFFMLLTLGIDSMFAGLENTQTAIVDTFPRLRPYKPFVALGICVFCFILGLTMCTNSGIYWIELCAYYNAGWAVLLMGGAECMVFAWVYGGRRLAGDIEIMIGFKLKPHWWITWCFVAPVVLVAIFIFNVIKFTPLTYGDYVLPPWAQLLGWLMAVNGVVMIPIVAVYRLIRTYKKRDYDGLSVIQRLAKLCKPLPKWSRNMLRNTGGGNTNSNNSTDLKEFSLRRRNTKGDGSGSGEPEVASPPPYSVSVGLHKNAYRNEAYDGSASQPDILGTSI